MALTLKDIAEKVGVAESTVSRAVNNKPGVSESTREKIMKVVREHNYRPNQLAQGLAKKETRMLALILSDLTSPGNSEIIKNIENAVNNAGYHLIICNTEQRPEKEEAYLRLVKKNRVDGAVVLGGELADKNILNLALDKKSKLVLINCLSEELLIPTILTDSAHGVYRAVKHLLVQDCQRVAMVMGDSDDYLESEKLEGYCQAFQEAGMEIDEDFIIETDGSRDGGYDSFFKLMSREESPDGFFASSELLAVGLIEAIKMGGYFIPDDFLVAGYGDGLITSIIDPPLTVIADPLEKLGKFAADYLLQLLNGEMPEEVIKVLKPVLKMRKSTNPQIK